MSLVVKDLAYNVRLLKEIIYPRQCAVCKKTIDDGCFCSVCRKGFLLLKHQCFTEQEPEILNRALELLPEDVLAEQVLVFKYDGVIKEGLHQLKFAADYSYLPPLREELALALPSNFVKWLQHYDYICCIPTSGERLAQRGYDIPCELFKDVLDSGACVHAEDLLERIRHTAPLYELNKEQRRHELCGCFAVKQGYDIRGKHILLCDDIYTTGSTFTEAAAVLLQAGAASVAALAFAAARENW